MLTESHVCFKSEVAGAQWVNLRPPPHTAPSSAPCPALEALFAPPAHPHPTATPAPTPDTRISLPSALLADKWRPKQYTQLLSDEKCNLKIMTYFESFARDTTEPANGTEPYILVLNGPPGVGKSSLCGVIARHWHFCPVEINASRERNEAQFMQTVHSVLQSSSASTTFGEAPEKSCLVVEELDGISGNGVGSLLQAVIARGRRCPVVCVTNDVYVPQLRSFRHHELVQCLTVPPIDEHPMLQRLAIIARAEDIYPGISTEKLRSILKKIASHANGDIRVALNLLQFAYLPQGATGPQSEPAGIDGNAPFATWAFLLTKKPHVVHSPESSNGPAVALLDQLKKCANIRLIADGVFENAVDSHGIGTLHYPKDNSFVRCCRLWSAVDGAHFGPIAETLLRVAIVSVYLSIQSNGKYVASGDYRWPRVENTKKPRETPRGQFLVEFIHTFARNFGGVLTFREVAMVYLPALLASTQSVGRLLNELNNYDYTRLSTVQQAVVEHVAGLLRFYGVIASPSNTLHTRRRTESGGFLSGVLRARLVDALMEVAAYCMLEKRGIFEISPHKRKNHRKQSVDRCANPNEPSPHEQMSLRALMRDAPKLPVSREAAAADKKRTDPFAKFRVAKVMKTDETGVTSSAAVHTESDPKRTCVTPSIKVRFRPYKYSTSAVLRKALISDFLVGHRL